MVTIGVVIPTPMCETLFAPVDRARLEALGQVRWWPQASAPDAEAAAALLADCQIGVGSWGTPHPGTSGLLARCQDLRLWEHAAGSVKAMFTPATAGRELTIASCKGAIADTVAELVVGELICGLRRIDLNAQANRRGPSGKPAGLRVLTGSTVGIIGASEVGKRVLTLLRPFAVETLVYDPYADPALLASLGARRVETVADLCARCDAITLHTPLLPATRHLLGAREFARLRDGALVINTSRGECVDEAALIRELETGRLHAWLDVTDPEPAAVDSPLRRLPNVVLTSHLAGPACALIGRRAVDDIAAFLGGRTPQCVVTADMLAAIA